jgi:protein-S-isoprenylcysteine O-methyltransferase Ste14
MSSGFNFQSKKFIGFVVVLLLWTACYISGFYTIPKEDIGFWKVLGIPMYLIVMLLYVGIIESLNFGKSISQQINKPQGQKLSFKEFLKEHLLAILFLAFLIWGFLFG